MTRGMFRRLGAAFILAGGIAALAGCSCDDCERSYYSHRADVDYHQCSDDGNVIAAIFVGGFVAAALLFEACCRCCHR